MLVENQDKNLQLNYKEINQALIHCIIKDSRPFCDFSKPGMMHFLSVVLPGYKPPHRRTIERNIQRVYKSYKKKLIDYLKTKSDVCLTTDMWKSKQLTYFLALTAHYLDDN